jgi:nitrite reductase (NADH) small subunit
MTWTRVCALEALVPDRGAAALVDGHQVALFRLDDSGDVHAVDHLDPFSNANVIARGLVGSRGGTPTVASPMYKQSFDLLTGQCLDDPDVSLRVWPTRVADGWVEVRGGSQ